jgi:hypothetical protein
MFEPLLICDEEMLLWYEQRFLDKYSPEYNINPQARNSLGRKASEETRHKISLSRKLRVTSEETKHKMSIAKLGKYPSEETRRRLSAAGKGKHSNHYKPLKHRVISPDGEIYEIKNRTKFCKTHDIIREGLYLIDTEKRPHYKGWRIVKDD